LSNLEAVKKLRKTTEGTEDTEKNLILIRLFSVLSVFSVVKYRFFHTFLSPELESPSNALLGTIRGELRPLTLTVSRSNWVNATIDAPPAASDPVGESTYG
jgi:hypothetical protein